MSVESTQKTTSDLIAMKLSNANSTVKDAYQQHLFRQQGIHACKQQVKLIIDLQKHRGCTLAILSGDHFFETQLYSIQKEITDDFHALERYSPIYLQQSELKQALQEWICLRRLWRKDSVQQNFMLHSNLIATLIKHSWQIAQRAGLLEIDSGQDQLVTFCLKTWLDVMESAAQARGLATHLAAQKSSSGDIISRIRFLAGHMLNSPNILNTITENLDTQHAACISKARDQMGFDSQLKVFLTALEQDLSNEAISETEADAIYTKGSHLISASQHILMVGIKLIERGLCPQLKSWIEGGGSIVRAYDPEEYPQESPLKSQG